MFPNRINFVYSYKYCNTITLAMSSYCIDLLTAQLNEITLSKFFFPDYPIALSTTVIVCLLPRRQRAPSNSQLLYMYISCYVGNWDMVFNEETARQIPIPLEFVANTFCVFIFSSSPCVYSCPKCWYIVCLVTRCAIGSASKAKLASGFYYQITVLHPVSVRSVSIINHRYPQRGSLV